MTVSLGRLAPLHVIIADENGIKVNPPPFRSSISLRGKLSLLPPRLHDDKQEKQNCNKKYLIFFCSGVSANKFSNWFLVSFFLGKTMRCQLRDFFRPTLLSATAGLLFNSSPSALIARRHLKEEERTKVPQLAPDFFSLARSQPHCIAFEARD